MMQLPGRVQAPESTTRPPPTPLPAPANRAGFDLGPQPNAD